MNNVRPYKVIVKNYFTHNHDFVIVLSDKGNYLAIDKKYIKDGKTTKPLTGAEMFASNSVEECIKNVETHFELEELISEGYSKAQAFAKLFNMEDKLDELEKLFA